MTKKSKSVAPLSRKKLVLRDIFAHCTKSGKFTFDNDLVKAISATHKFANPFDATKNDNLSVLPDEVSKAGYCILHLGNGLHRFVKAINQCFHEFETITDDEILWEYRSSILNETDTSESNILSVGFNQKITHDFLYGKSDATPKMYGARRTRITANYKVGTAKIEVTKLQVEVDMTTEYKGTVTVFEGKNKFHTNFAVYQIFHPVIYYHQLNKAKKVGINKVNCCYLLRDVQGGNSVLRLYLYSFTDINDIASIKLEKCKQYRLIKK